MQYLYLATIVLLLIFVVFLLTYSFYKIRRIDKRVSEALARMMKLQRTDLIDVSQQFQNLAILQYELSLKRPLPPTRGWVASPDFLLLISRHAHAVKPEVVVECSSGVSTLVLASCLRDNGKGHVYSLENDEVFARQTRTHLEREGLSEWATVLHAPLTNQTIDNRQFSWYDISSLPVMAIDLIVVDGPPHFVGPMARYPAGPMLFTRLADDGMIFADDAARTEEEATLAAWRREFPVFEESYHHCEKGCTSFHKPSRQ
jgi:predicted O-methyltransferase YrrM